MLQKNHHFLFPQTYFGSHEQMESDFFDEDQTDVIEPWILILENDPTNQFQQKIGLFIHWFDDLS